MKAVAVMAVFASLMIVPVSAEASSWGANPLAGYDNQKQGNISFHPDFNKHDVVSPKSYGWVHSKVCGMSLCAGADKEDKQPSFLQGPKFEAPQTLSPYLGMSATGERSAFDRADVVILFDGKFFIKGFFPQ